MDNVLESYLVRLGFSPDQSSFRKFQETLKDADSAVDRHASGMLKSLLKAQTGILGAFTSVSAAIIGMVDKVAMADQGYRLMGLRMLMTADSARKLDIITKGLGASLEEITWDPELHARAIAMSEDIDKLSTQLGPDFEKNMLRIRDVRFEFSRLGVTLKFLSMQFVGSLFSKFGVDIDNIQGKLHDWVDWLQENVPGIADKFATYLVPVLKDTWMLFTHVWEAAKAFGVAFSNVVGLLSGDNSIEGSVFKFENLAKALSHIVDWLAYLADSITHAEEFVAHMANGILMLATNTDKATSSLLELKTAFLHIGSASGAIIGAGVGSVIPGVGTAVGALTGFGVGSIIEGVRELSGEQGPKTVGSPPDLIKAIAAAAAKYRIPESLLLGLAKQESGIKQTDAHGNIIKSKTGALGVMQLEPPTARDLGVDPNDAGQNIEGGAHYLRMMLNKFGGDTEKAIAAYNAGPGNVEKWMRGGSLPAETQKYVPSVLANQAQFERSAAYLSHTSAASAAPRGDSVINVTVGDIHVSKSDASAADIKRELLSEMDYRMKFQTQMDLSQLNPAY